MARSKPAKSRTQLGPRLAFPNGAYMSILRNSGPLFDRQVSNLQTRHPGLLPPELVAEIGSLLPFSTLCSAVYVSRYWRATLLASPRLWDDIAVNLCQRHKHRWTDVLELLFARNAGRPLSMSLGWTGSCYADTDWNALHSVSVLIASHMPHIKSLSFQLPYRSDMLLFLVPAPILKTLEVDDSEGTHLETLPVDLFAGIAPCLSSLHLHEVQLPPQCPALRLVTKLALTCLYGRQGPHRLSLIGHLPLLDELKVWLHCGSLVETGPPSELAIDLHLTSSLALEPMLALFPRARVSYDLSIDGPLPKSPEPYLEDVAAAVERSMRTVPNPTSIHIRWEPPFSYYPDTLAVVLDDRRVIKHVQLPALKPVLSVELIQSIVRTVTSLTVPEELWEIFELCTLLPNLDLTLFVSQGVEGHSPGCTLILYLSARSVRKSIRSLALARPPKCFYYADIPDAPEWILSATLLQEFVASLVAPGSLQSLTLHGIVLDGTATFDSINLAVCTVADLVTPEVEAARRKYELENGVLSI